MFYDNLLNACQKNNIRVTALVDELKISSGNLSKWKSGGNPKGDTLLILSKRLAVSTDYLLTGKEKKSAPELTETEKECLDKFNTLTEIDKGRILDRMQTMLDSYTPEEKEKRSV